LGVETCTLVGASPIAVSNAVGIRPGWQTQSVVALHVDAVTATLASSGIVVDLKFDGQRPTFAGGNPFPLETCCV
jgi:hypothetical protein